MQEIKFFSGETIPLERHKVRIVQKLELLPVDQRLRKLQDARNNLYLLHNRDIFLDMLTDSGVNAMSDRQLASMMDADDSYAGSESFFQLADKVTELFGMEYFLPAHQGRACESILAQLLVKPGDIIPMNYHFTTAKAHIVRCGGEVVEVLQPKGLECESEDLFKGDVDLNVLCDFLTREHERIPFVRMEAGTNLIGGQPFSMGNLKAVAELCRRFEIPLVLDASLLQDNLYFLKVNDPSCQHRMVREITREIADLSDIIYFSARKLGFARGGGIALRDQTLYSQM